MNADDPRHGQRRGYYAHRKDGETACDPCKRAAAGQEARYAMQRENGISGRIDPTGTQRRLQALVAIGYTWTALDEWMGNRMAEKFGSGRLAYVFPATAAKVSDLYDALSMTTPPRTNMRERQAYTKARNMAARNGWPVPLAWPDDLIDDPDYHPGEWQYVPATRAETFTELAERGATVTEACRVLKVSREGLEKWADRAGRRPEFNAMTAKETAVFEYRNQHSKGVA